MGNTAAREILEHCGLAGLSLERIDEVILLDIDWQGWDEIRYPATGLAAMVGHEKDAELQPNWTFTNRPQDYFDYYELAPHVKGPPYWRLSFDESAGAVEVTCPQEQVHPLRR